MTGIGIHGTGGTGGTGFPISSGSSIIGTGSNNTISETWLEKIKRLLNSNNSSGQPVSINEAMQNVGDLPPGVTAEMIESMLSTYDSGESDSDSGTSSIRAYNDNEISKMSPSAKKAEVEKLGYNAESLSDDVINYCLKNPEKAQSYINTEEMTRLKQDEQQLTGQLNSIENGENGIGKNGSKLFQGIDDAKLQTSGLSASQISALKNNQYIKPGADDPDGTKLKASLKNLGLSSEEINNYTKASQLDSSITLNKEAQAKIKAAATIEVSTAAMEESFVAEKEDGIDPSYDENEVFPPSEDLNMANLEQLAGDIDIGAKDPSTLSNEELQSEIERVTEEQLDNEMQIAEAEGIDAEAPDGSRVMDSMLQADKDAVVSAQEDVESSDKEVKDAENEKVESEEEVREKTQDYSDKQSIMDKIDSQVQKMTTVVNGLDTLYKATLAIAKALLHSPHTHAAGQAMMAKAKAIGVKLQIAKNALNVAKAGLQVAKGDFNLASELKNFAINQFAQNDENFAKMVDYYDKAKGALDTGKAVLNMNKGNFLQTMSVVASQYSEYKNSLDTEKSKRERGENAGIDGTGSKRSGGVLGTLFNAGTNGIQPTEKQTAQLEKDQKSGTFWGDMFGAVGAVGKATGNALGLNKKDKKTNPTNK